MTSLEEIWPAAGLRARAGHMELRGIHDDDTMPFLVPWTRGEPHEVARSVVAYQWQARTAFGHGRLALELAVLLDGEPVGIQAASGEDYGVLRSVETGSWLGREYQSRGIGRRMRALMLHLMFEGLDSLLRVKL